jgi:hypothetical protein
MQILVLYLQHIATDYKFLRFNLIAALYNNDKSLAGHDMTKIASVL